MFLKRALGFTRWLLPPRLPPRCLRASTLYPTLVMRRLLAVECSPWGERRLPVKTKNKRKVVRSSVFLYFAPAPLLQRFKKVYEYRYSLRAEGDRASPSRVVRGPAEHPCWATSGHTSLSQTLKAL